MQRTGVISRIFLCIVVLVCLIPTRSFGWGRDGHAAIVRLAFQLMPSVQRERLYAIFHSTDPFQIGSWADKGGKKKYPESKPWHFVDIPKDATQYEASRDCKKGCLISELSALENELNSKSLSKKKRRVAMLFYLHFLGDLYQPFHTLGPDGANDVPVKFHGETKSLHWVWDEGIIKDHDIDTVTLLNSAKTMRTGPVETDYVKIAMEGHRIAVANLVTSGKRLPNDYTDQKWPIVEHALIEAALLIVAKMGDM